MTFTEDFIPVEEGEEFQAAAPTYPTAFGITLTPAVSGVLLAVLGLAGSAYLLLNLVMPAWENYQKLQADLAQKQAQVQQNQAVLKQIETVKTQLVQAKQQQADVLALFANEKTLDTLLLDLNRVVETSGNTTNQSETTAKLKRFVPANQSTEVVTDGSLGPEVNGKLKRRVVNIEFEGTFEQTQSILRNIERLQPLLIVKDYQSRTAQSPSDSKGKGLRGPITITTSFQLQALIPLSADEAVNAATAANQQKK